VDTTLLDPQARGSARLLSASGRNFVRSPIGKLARGDGDLDRLTLMRRERDPLEPGQRVNGRRSRAAETLVAQGEKGDAASFRDADRLIRDALGMSQHPLDPNYRDSLEEIRRRIPSSVTTSPNSQ